VLVIRQSLLPALLLAAAGPVAAELVYVDSAPDPAAVVTVDTRPETACLERTLNNARCLPPEAFLGPRRRLASFRDIVWVLGAAGLRGDETVLVAGADPVRRDAVAALLHLAGQDRVEVLIPPLAQYLGTSGAVAAPGRARGVLRDPIYTGQLREALIVLRDELARRLTEPGAPRLLDGRPVDEYWGERLRARRGGHLPGAELAPAAKLRSALARGEKPLAATGEVVVYGHEPLTGLAYLTLLRAGYDIDARLYPGGWREWADDGRLPADAAVYREPESAPVEQSGAVGAGPWAQALLTLGAALAAALFGYLLGRRRIA
jgi:thiosulfate/3-mercaptopyruvate sulfurtransferase